MNNTAFTEYGPTNEELEEAKATIKKKAAWMNLPVAEVAELYADEFLKYFTKKGRLRKNIISVSSGLGRQVTLYYLAGQQLADEHETHCTHEWVVFSTALQEVCLMVVCVNCGVNGTVNDPSEDEWRRAFRAPSQPFKWDAKERVTVWGFPKVCPAEQVR
jgi:hypothetical protein